MTRKAQDLGTASLALSLVRVTRAAMSLTVLLILIFTPFNVGAAQKKPERLDGLVEPVYKGQALSHWIEILNGGLFSSKWWPDISEIEGGAEAQEALEHIDSLAVPFLLERIPERGAMIAFRVLGPRARAAIPDLVAMTTNQIAAAPPRERFIGGLSVIGSEPMQVLGWIGPDALPALSMFLTNYSDPRVRFPALKAVGTMGTNGSPALPAVFPCVKDENEMVAREAVSVLGQMGHDPLVLQALINTLHLRPDLKSETVAALSNLGEDALLVIVGELPGARSGTKYIVGNTFIQKSPGVLTNQALLEVLATELRSPDPVERDWAALMLRAADEQSRGLEPRPLWDAVGGWDHARQDSTNVLRRLAPSLVK